MKQESTMGGSSSTIQAFDLMVVLERIILWYIPYQESRMNNDNEASLLNVGDV